MRLAVAMTGGCLVTSLVAALVSPDARLELMLGMAMPLVVAVCSAILVERTFARDPVQLTPLMVKAFGVKMLVFGAYVAIVVGLTSLDPIPFIASFCAYFVTLHLTEAWRLRSLFANSAS